MSTVEDLGLRVDIAEAIPGPRIVAGGRLPTHVVLVADWAMDQERYGDGELSDEGLLERAALELLRAALEGIDVLGDDRYSRRWTDAMRRRRRRRRVQAVLTGVRGARSDSW